MGQVPHREQTRFGDLEVSVGFTPVIEQDPPLPEHLKTLNN